MFVAPFSMNARFSYRERNAGAGRRRLIIATIVIVAIFAVDIATGGAIRSIVRSSAARISLTFHAVGVHIDASGIFATRAALASQNEALKAQIATLEERAALSSALQAQVIALSSVAHLAASEQGITASIASSLIASPYGTFLIGAGVDEGVVVNSLVLSDNGTAIGTVSTVGPHTSTVTEVFASGHSTDALLDGAPITVRGSGGENATALVPHGVTVLPGDAVTAPSLQDRTIGVVGHVNTDPSSAAMEVYIGSPVNLSALNYVFVVAASK
jgi:cell shape-determining protein MreC